MTGEISPRDGGRCISITEGTAKQQQQKDPKRNDLDKMKRVPGGQSSEARGSGLAGGSAIQHGASLSGSREAPGQGAGGEPGDRKSTRLNSSH